MTQIKLLTPNKIVRTKRRSISLIISNSGEFFVRAPIRCSDKDIYDFIIKIADWIIEKRRLSLANKISEITFDKGNTIHLLGVEYTFDYHDSSRVKLINDKIFLPKEDTKNRFIRYLKSFAKKYLTMRVSHIAESLHFTYDTIGISSARTCWGSCSFKNKLHFTYKLMLCPKEIVDYIIVHELSHTRVKNHSKAFWDIVAKIYPEYKQCEKWLKANRNIIDLI
ncbi:MAG: M48 family metallopeptidase [Clostridiales bacterium]|nr:M48 family metallopeptidase [Clostridiales bacterium]